MCYIWCYYSVVLRFKSELVTGINFAKHNPLNGKVAPIFKGPNTRNSPSTITTKSDFEVITIKGNITITCISNFPNIGMFPHRKNINIYSLRNICKFILLCIMMFAKTSMYGCIFLLLPALWFDTWAVTQPIPGKVTCGPQPYSPSPL